MAIDLTWYLDLFSMVFSLMVGLMILTLRKKSENHPMTLSQRWGLSIIGMLYIINTMVLAIYCVTRSHNPFNPPDFSDHLGDFNGTLNVLTFLFLLGFGLVYPRPIMKWSKLRNLFAILAVCWVFLFLEHNNRLNGEGLLRSIDIQGYVYIACTFIPIFLWLPEYDRQTSPQMRMTLTILIWGYLFYNFTMNGSYLVPQIPKGTASTEGIVAITLVAIVLILILRTLYHRRGNWTSAEKLNLLLMGVCIILIILTSRIVAVENTEQKNFYTNPVLASIFYMATMGGWTLVRPLLFSYGLLRYQFFGPDVKADTMFHRIGGIVGSTAIFVLVLASLIKWSIIGSIGISFGVGMVFYVPSFRLTKWVISRALPLSTSAKLTLSERRTIYLMGLQTAVIHGEIDEPFDEEVLDRLRRTLKVSKREHRILMAGFSKEKPLLAKEEIEEVYLFHKDGAHLGHAASKEVEEEGKGAMMATMFTAVRDFAKDALRTGGEHVDSIEYGYSTLIVEIEGDIALGLLLRGRDNPTVRQRMREILDAVHKGYDKKIASMLKKGIHEDEAVKAHLEGLEELLTEFLEE